MKKVKTKLPAGRILSLKKLPDGTFEVIQEVKDDNNLILIEAESLSRSDKFMKHIPRTESEKVTRALIIEAITKGVKNFYRPKYDPSFTVDGSIQFLSRKKPAVGKSYREWVKLAKAYNPERNSRLGTRLEYGAFLGVLIKKLVEEGKSISWAWNAVCNDSKELGHYWNSKYAKRMLEATGLRGIIGFNDLANTYKILANDDVAEATKSFCIAGGSCDNRGFESPVANIVWCHFCLSKCKYAVGWIVLSEDDTV